MFPNRILSYAVLNMITMQRENKYAVDSTYVFGDEMKQAFK